MNEKPTHLDLCSGIGGFSLAFESAGFKTIAFSEIDPYASAVLRKHWPSVPNLGDLRWITPRALEVGCGTRRINALTAGIPCQPFSIAGKQRGERDVRHIWPAVLRITKRLRPDWVVLENVVGFIRLALDKTIVDLEDINYSVQSFVIPACAVGADHGRNRIWIVAHSNSQGFQGLHNARNQIDLQFSEKDIPEIVGLPTPRVCRGEDGIPNRVDRIKCLGNSIVPKVAFEISKAIASAMRI